MTEAEWQTTDSFVQMYEFVRPRATTRQLRLTMVAFCRLLSADLSSPTTEEILRSAEWLADDPLAESWAQDLYDEFITQSRETRARSGAERKLARVLSAAWNPLVKLIDGGYFASAADAFANALFFSVRGNPGTIITGGDGDTVTYCARAVHRAALLLSGLSPREAFASQEEGRLETSTPGLLAGVLREVFGNPFRCVPFDPCWRTGTALSLSRSIYEDRAFDRLPILADSLEDAGCHDRPLLDHLRGPGPHVRGCFALDLVLARG